MKVLVLTRYDSMGASSRMRFLQYLPWLDSASWSYEVEPFFTNEMLQGRYNMGSYKFSELQEAYVNRLTRMARCRHYDLVWLEKEALPWFPASLERWLLGEVPYVLDFDDAVFHNYDRHPLGIVRILFGRRLDRLMEGAHLVIAGNKYLAQRAISAGAGWVEQLPTVIELARYPSFGKGARSRLRIVWIGSPSTVRYLAGLHESLVELAKRAPFTLRVIGGMPLDMSGIDLEVLPWAADTEVASIAECDVGIMPLLDSPWERGKCAYKLIQYMACALPTVSSPVGANLDVVIEGETGFFARSQEDWADRLECLLRDEGLRKRLGEKGRERIEAEYCVEQTAPKLMKLLAAAAVSG